MIHRVLGSHGLNATELSPAHQLHARRNPTCSKQIHTLQGISATRPTLQGSTLHPRCCCTNTRRVPTPHDTSAMQGSKHVFKQQQYNYEISFSSQSLPSRGEALQIKRPEVPHLHTAKITAC